MDSVRAHSPSLTLINLIVSGKTTDLARYQKHAPLVSRGVALVMGAVGLGGAGVAEVIAIFVDF